MHGRFLTSGSSRSRAVADVLGATGGAAGCGATCAPYGAIAEELSLPPVKIHCSVLAEDAIKAALADYRRKQAARNAPTA